MRVIRGQLQMTYSEDGDDTGILPIRFRMNKNERKAVLKAPGKFVTACQDQFILPEPGCHCSHCRAGYDCCGRMFPTYVKVEAVKRGVRLVQFYVRNV